MTSPYYKTFSNFAGGTHFSGTIDFRNLGLFAEGFPQAARDEITRLLKDAQELSLQTIHMMLKKAQSANRNPVRFNYHDKHSRGTGRSSSLKYSGIVGSGGGVFDKIANSIRTTIETKSDNVRVGTFSDPYPSGAIGHRGGKIARIHEQGTGPFFTGAHSRGGGFMHAGFRKIGYMEEGERAQEQYVRNNLDRYLKRLTPGGV